MGCQRGARFSLGRPACTLGLGPCALLADSLLLEVGRYAELAQEVRSQLIRHVQGLDVMVAAIQRGKLDPTAHRGIATM